MTYFNGMLYHFKRNALVEGSTHFKGLHHSFSRESFKVLEYVLTQGFEPTMSISKSILHIHWLPMFLHLFNTVFEKLYKQTKLPSLCSKPPKLPPVHTCILPSFLGGSPMETTGPKQPIRSTKSKFATPIVGELAKSEVKVLHFCVVLPALQKTSNEPENQKTKKPKKTKKQNNIAHSKGESSGRELGLVIFFWFLVFCFFGFWFRLAIAEKPTTNQKTRNQETNKLKKQETKNKKQKKQDCTPQGGSSGRELGLVIFFVLVFLFFGFWVRLAIAEKPSRNCQWLQSSERTITDAVVAKMCSFSGCRMQWKTAFPGCPLLLVFQLLFLSCFTRIYIHCRNLGLPHVIGVNRAVIYMSLVGPTII